MHIETSVQINPVRVRKETGDSHSISRSTKQTNTTPFKMLNPKVGKRPVFKEYTMLPVDGQDASAAMGTGKRGLCSPSHCRDRRAAVPQRRSPGATGTLPPADRSAT